MERSGSSRSDPLAGLNEEQRAAVAATEGPVLILAGAGSGKTRVITHRIAHLVLDHGVRPEEILAVTFTNKAAGEMRERVSALLGGGRLPLWVSTFHSFCVRLLRREASGAGLRRRLRHLRRGRPARGGEGGAARPRSLGEAPSAAARSLEDLRGEELGAQPRRGRRDIRRRRALPIAGRYEETLRAANAVDFDDLLLLAVSLLAREQAVRAAWRRRFRYVLVDEYQDTNASQYEIVRLLAGDGGNLTVVGDEDQSIYSWRGADISNILDFERDFPGARVFRLQRTTALARRFSTWRALSSPTTAGARARCCPRCARAASPCACTRPRTSTARPTSSSSASRPRPAAPTAVLFRTNAQSRLFEEGLLRRRIPYAVVGGVGFYERREVKDALAYLRLVANPGDSAAFARVVNVPPRGIGAKTVEEIERRSREGEVSLFGCDAKAPRDFGAARTGARRRALVRGARREAPRGCREAVREALLERALGTAATRPPSPSRTTRRARIDSRTSRSSSRPPPSTSAGRAIRASAASSIRWRC